MAGNSLREYSRESSTSICEVKSPAAPVGMGYNTMGNPSAGGVFSMWPPRNELDESIWSGRTVTTVGRARPRARAFCPAVVRHSRRCRARCLGVVSPPGDAARKRSRVALPGGSQRRDQRTAIGWEKSPAGNCRGPSRGILVPPAGVRPAGRGGGRPGPWPACPSSSGRQSYFGCGAGCHSSRLRRSTGCSTSSTHRWYQKGLATLRERLGEKCPEKKTPRKTRTN